MIQVAVAARRLIVFIRDETSWKFAKVIQVPIKANQRQIYGNFDAELIFSFYKTSSSRFNTIDCLLTAWMQELINNNKNNKGLYFKCKSNVFSS